MNATPSQIGTTTEQLKNARHKKRIVILIHQRSTICIYEIIVELTFFVLYFLACAIGQLHGCKENPIANSATLFVNRQAADLLSSKMAARLLLTLTMINIIDS